MDAILRQVDRDGDMLTAADKKLRDKMHAVCQSVIYATAQERVQDARKRGALIQAIKLDESGNRFVRDEGNRFARDVEEGRPRQDMRAFNWKWKGFGDKRYVNVMMDRAMGDKGSTDTGTVVGYAAQMATGNHPGGMPLIDFIRSLKPFMDVKMPDGTTRSEPIDGKAGGGIMPAGTVQRINEDLHVTDPFDAARRIASTYSESQSGSPVTQTTGGLRIWRRMGENTKVGETFMAKAWPAADVLGTAMRSSGFQDAIESDKQAQAALVQQYIRQLFGVQR